MAARRFSLGKGIATALGFVLVAFLVTDFMQLIRPSGLSAITCTSNLFREPTDAMRLVSQLRDAIVHQSEINDLPSALVAAVIVDHQRQLTSYRAFTDCFGSALGADLSLGPAQIRMSTAAQLDGNDLNGMPAPLFRVLRSELLDTESNVSYEARELRALLDRQHRSPGISASSLLNSPDVMALLITEYRSGRMSTGSADSRIGANAIRTLGVIQDSTLAQFGESDADSIRVREAIGKYLARVRCESGMSNRACEREARQFPPTDSFR